MQITLSSKLYIWIIYQDKSYWKVQPQLLELLNLELKDRKFKETETGSKTRPCSVQPFDWLERQAECSGCYLYPL